MSLWGSPSLSNHHRKFGGGGGGGYFKALHKSALLILVLLALRMLKQTCCLELKVSLDYTLIPYFQPVNGGACL